ncbi:MAG: MMPL family transporter [Zoogloeaceae bacterium]|jgi:predicted RND superfamily exporter protein|nr:MMPL family transporter [Zoogloeaceae bacterium]
MQGGSNIDHMPVVADYNHFDASSGNRLERAIFNNRVVVVLFCLCATLALAWLVATRIDINANFEKMLPQAHPYIKNYLAHKNDLRGLGNAIRIVVENPHGTVFEPDYLEALRRINDEVYLTPGADRAWIKSLWMPAVRWTEVTEEGFRGGPVMPPDYDGSARSIDQLRANVARAGIAGALVGNDQRSSMIVVPLLDIDPQSGQALDYVNFAKHIESIRGRHDGAQSGVRIHVIGFATLVGDLVTGLRDMLIFFCASVAIAIGLLYGYTRCLRSTLLVVFCSAVAVLWQLGIVTALGYPIDPFSILVPFLIFAIGVSHGAQKMNGIAQDIGRGTHQHVAARYTFRRLFLAGFTALLADAVGFAVLMLIDIPVIRELAQSASIGVAVLVITNLVLLPVLLSYTGVSRRAAAHRLSIEACEEAGRGLGVLWSWLERFTERSWAVAALGLAGLATVIGFVVSLQLQIGDLDEGAPELRPDSRYNRDNAYITTHYALSSDVFAVIVKTLPEHCLTYKALQQADRLAWMLEQLPTVQATHSLPGSVRQIVAGTYDGNPKFLSLLRNQEVLTSAVRQAAVNNADLYNTDCSVMPVLAYLQDHKAATLDAVVDAAETFSRTNNDEDVNFALAAGSAGIEAATNIVVRQENRTMLLSIYAAVALLCLVAFRSWRAVIVAIVPLAITSVLCEALMVALGIGIKVATLPVVALGVGIGVDYALYLLSVQLAHQRRGLSLREAYKRSVEFTGRVVGLVGVTLAAGVVTWAWSPIKFQADMGILLTFMFGLNMIGALILIPALSHFLLNSRQPSLTAGETGLEKS